MSKIRYAQKAILLARVSTKEQAESEHLSIPAQLRIINEYAQAGGRFKSIKEVIGEPIQLEESATKGNRKKFEQIFKMVEEPKEPIAVVVERVDRLQRQWRETVRFDDLRRQGKVELHFVSQGLVVHKNSPSSDLMTWDFFVLTAKAYAAAISENVKRSIRAAVQKGEFRALAPLGYANIHKEQNRVIIKTVEKDWRAPLVTECFIKYATGKYSQSSLADEMAKKGLTERKKKGQEDRPVTSGTLHQVLCNPFYYGSFLWVDENGDRQLIKATNYEPLISKELFDKVQRVMKQGTKPTEKKRNFKFKKALKCGFCGSTMTGEKMTGTYKDPNSPGAQTVYYHCSSARLATDKDWYRKKFGTDHSGVRVAVRGKVKGETLINCPQRWWKEQEVDNEIAKWLTVIYYDEKRAKEMTEAMVKDLEMTKAEADLQIAALRRKNTDLRMLVSNLTRQYATEQDLGIKDELRKALNETREEITRNEQDILSLSEAVEFEEGELLDVLSVAGNLLDHYKKLGPEDQVRLLQMVFREITLTRGEWKIKGKKVKDYSIAVTFSHIFQELFELGLMRYYPEEDDNEPVTKKETKEEY